MHDIVEQITKQTVTLRTSKFPATDGNGETGAIGLSEDVVFGSDNGSDKSGVKV